MSMILCWNKQKIFKLVMPLLASEKNGGFEDYSSMSMRLPKSIFLAQIASIDVSYAGTDWKVALLVLCPRNTQNNATPLFYPDQTQQAMIKRSAGEILVQSVLWIGFAIAESRLSFRDKNFAQVSDTWYAKAMTRDGFRLLTASIVSSDKLRAKAVPD